MSPSKPKSLLNLPGMLAENALAGFKATLIVLRLSDIKGLKKRTRRNVAPRYRFTTFVWKWHSGIYIAVTLKPCESILDAKGYILRLDKKKKNRVKKGVLRLRIRLKLEKLFALNYVRVKHLRRLENISENMTLQTSVWMLCLSSWMYFFSLKKNYSQVLLSY